MAGGWLARAWLVAGTERPALRTSSSARPPRQGAGQGCVRQQPAARCLPEGRLGGCDRRRQPRWWEEKLETHTQSSCMREGMKTSSSQLEAKPKSSKQDCLGLGLLCKCSHLFSVWLVWVSCPCDCPNPAQVVFTSLKKAHSRQSTIQCDVFSGFYDCSMANCRPSPTPPTDRWDMRAVILQAFTRIFLHLTAFFISMC